MGHSFGTQAVTNPLRDLPPIRKWHAVVHEMKEH